MRRAAGSVGFAQSPWLSEAVRAAEGWDAIGRRA